MVILEISQKHPFDIIVVRPRGTHRLCCAHIVQLMTHLAIYTVPFTLQLCYKPLGILQKITKSQKVHISSHDELQKFHNTNFTWHRSQGFLRERVEKQEFPPSPVTFFKSNQKPFPWNLRVNITYQMRSREEVGLVIPRHVMNIPVVIKTFKFSLTSDFYRLGDNANEYHNYIEYLFILQTAHSDSSFHYLNCFLEQKLKNFNLILGQIGFELPKFPKTGKCLLTVFFHRTTFQ